MKTAPAELAGYSEYKILDVKTKELINHRMPPRASLEPMRVTMTKTLQPYWGTQSRIQIA